MKSLSVHELKDLLLAGRITLVDVREPEELDIAAIEGARHIPLHLLPLRAAELDRNAPTAVICHHGGRSAMAVHWLQQHGWSDVANVIGGIDAWSGAIDPRVPRY